MVVVATQLMLAGMWGAVLHSFFSGLCVAATHISGFGLWLGLCSDARLDCVAMIYRCLTGAGLCSGAIF